MGLCDLYKAKELKILILITILISAQICVTLELCHCPCAAVVVYLLDHISCVAKGVMFKTYKFKVLL